jgi:hypothetical protein
MENGRRLLSKASRAAVHVRAPKRAHHFSVTCSEPAHQRLLDQPENPVEQYRRCRSQRFSVFAFSLLFAHSFPVTPKSFPVNFDNEFRLKPAWLLRLLMMPSSFGAQIFGFPLYFSLLIRE